MTMIKSNANNSDLKTRRGIVAAASWMVDRVKLVDVWPEEEHLAEIIETDLQGGGSAHNLGVDIRKLDASMPVEAIGLIGEDADAEFLLQRIKAVGIDTRQLQKTSEANTSFTDVISDSRTGKRTFFHHRGANNLVRPQHFDFSQCSARILHLGLIGLHEFLDGPNETDSGATDPSGWVTVLKAAQAAGIKTNIELVSIAPERIREIALPCLPHLDTLIANEFEAGALAEVNTQAADGSIDSEQCLLAASKILQQGNMSLVVVHFPGGAVAIDRDGQSFFKASFTVPESFICSAVGAGDAFAAGLLYGLHEAWPVVDSMELAHAAAAASLRSMNTVGSVESVEDCLAFARGLNG